MTYRPRAAAPVLLLSLLGCPGSGKDTLADSGPAPPDCTTDEILDGGACVPTECGTGTWGDLEVADSDVFVDVAAAAGGDGSEGAPFQSIQDGANRAGSAGGGRVVVASGTYAEILTLGAEHDGVDVVGRCRALVTIDGSGGEDEEPGVTLDGDRQAPAVALRSLTITGGRYSGLWVASGAATLTGVDFVANRLMGILIMGDDASATLDGVSVLDSEVYDDAYGRGICVQDGAAMTAKNLLIEGNTEIGLFVEGAGTEVELEASSIIGTLSRPDGGYGHGPVVVSGTVSFSDGAIAGNHQFGVYASGAGVVVGLTDTSVTGTLPTGDDDDGVGLVVRDGATASGTRLTVEGNTEIGVFVAAAGSTLAMTAGRVRGTLANRDGEFGRGVSVQGGGLYTGTNVAIEGNGEMGIFCADEGAVSLTSSSVSGNAVAGLDIQDAGQATLTGCTLDGNEAYGAYVYGEGSTLVLDDTSVMGTVGLDGGVAFGVTAFGGASASLLGSSVEGTYGVGVSATDAGTTMTMTDSSVLYTVPLDDGSYGRGVQVGGGATFTGLRLSVERNTELGMIIGDAGTVAVLEETTIADTLSSPDGTGGRGVQVGLGATASFTDSIIDGNMECGIIAGADGTTLQLVDSSIVHTSPLADGTTGGGLLIQRGATATVSGSVIEANTQVGAFAGGDGAVLNLTDSSIVGTVSSRSTAFAVGLWSQDGAVVTASGLDVSGTEGPGMYVIGGSLTCDTCAIRDSAFAGALAPYGPLTLSHTTITDTRADSEYGGGFGVYAVTPYGPPTVTLTDSVIGPHAYAAIWLDGAGSYDIQRNVLSGGPGFVDGGGNTLHGNALFAENGVTAWTGATDGPSGLNFVGNTVSGASAIGFFLHGASATLADNVWSSNTVDIRQQSCDGVTPLTAEDIAGAPNAVVCPETNVLIAYDIEFESFVPTVSSE